jgi:hypothetical protein
MVEEGNGKEVDKKLLKRVKYVYYISIVYWNLHISCLRFLNIRNKKNNLDMKYEKNQTALKNQISEIQCTPSYTVHPHLPPSNFKVQIFQNNIVFNWISPSIYYHSSLSPKYSLVKKGWCCEGIKDLRFHLTQSNWIWFSLNTGVKLTD